MSIKNEGSLVFWLNHEHKDWPTNSSGYNFGTSRIEDISAETKKHPDKTIEIKIIGPFNKTFVFQRPIPPCDQRGLQVVITWGNDKVQLYLNGKLEDSKTIGEAEK
jgi:hypothetical protein